MAYKLGDLKSLVATDPVDQDIIFLKMNLRNAIIQMIRKNEWTQCIAAKKMGVSQPRISSLNQTKLEEFSIDSLMTMLLKAGSRLQTDASSCDDAAAFLALTFNKTAI
ncbi:helix-turn-helix domain-containing protein [Photobacterium leiognathi]|uniref:helix-turn-helix domain-containing protein n=1 Tax=Photobacterium leiognathi TaxID=553611 RepID=UPI00298190C0|nr:XRE family transcriptional regulator [Photobacterium leiognathi]